MSQVSELYVGADTRTIVVPENESLVLKAQPEIQYDAINVYLENAFSSVAFSPEIAAVTNLVLSDSARYMYNFNATTNQVEITNKQGSLVTTLPIDDAGFTTSVKLAGGYFNELKVDLTTFKLTGQPELASEFYVSDYADSVTVPEGEYLELKAKPDTQYSDIIEVTLSGADSRVAIAEELGSYVKLTLPAASVYSYHFNNADNVIEIRTTDGQFVAALPINTDGFTSEFKVANGVYTFLQVDTATSSVIEHRVEPTLDTSEALTIQIVEPGVLEIDNLSQYNITLSWSGDAGRSVATFVHDTLPESQSYQFDFTTQPLNKILLSGDYFDFIAHPEAISGLEIEVRPFENMDEGEENSFWWGITTVLEGDTDQPIDLTHVRTDIDTTRATFSAGLQLPAQNCLCDSTTEINETFYWALHPEHANQLEVSGAGWISLYGTSGKALDFSKIATNLSIDGAILTGGFILPSVGNQTNNEDYPLYLDVSPEQANGLIFSSDDFELYIFGDSDALVNLTGITSALYAAELQGEVLFPVTKDEDMLIVHSNQINNQTLYQSDSQGKLGVEEVNSNTVFPENSSELDVFYIGLAQDAEGEINLAPFGQNLEIVWAEQTTKEIYLTTGDGDQELIAGSGKNHLTGGSGDDVFIFEPDHAGSSIITDFLLGNDKIEFNFDYWYSYSELSLLGQEFLRGAGNLYQELGTDDTIDTDTGFIVFNESTLQNSVASALAAANSLLGIKSGDWFYLATDDTKDTALFYLQENTGDEILDSGIHLVTLLGVADASTLSVGNFSNFRDANDNISDGLIEG